VSNFNGTYLTELNYGTAVDFQIRATKGSQESGNYIKVFEFFDGFNESFQFAGYFLVCDERGAGVGSQADVGKLRNC